MRFRSWSCGEATIRISLLLVSLVAIYLFINDVRLSFLFEGLSENAAEVTIVSSESEDEIGAPGDTGVVVIGSSSSSLREMSPDGCWKGVPTYKGVNCMLYFEIIGFAKCGSTFVDSMMLQLPEVRNNRFRALKVLPHFVGRVRDQHDYDVSTSSSMSHQHNNFIPSLISSHPISTTSITKPITPPISSEGGKSLWARASQPSCTTTKDSLNIMQPSIPTSSKRRVLDHFIDTTVFTSLMVGKHQVDSVG